MSVLYENRRLQVWNHLQIPSPERQSYSLTNLRFKPYWSPFATGKSSHNCCIALELSSSNSIGALVRNWSLSTLHRLFGLQFHFITLHYISDQLWCMLGGNVCSWMKSSLFWFTEGQTHFNTSWHSEASLTLIGLDIECSLLKAPHYLQPCTKNLLKMEGLVCRSNFRLRLWFRL